MSKHKAANSDLAQQIADAPDRQVHVVYVREWKLTIRLRSWSSGDRGAFDAESVFFREHLDEETCERLIVPRAIARSIVDHDDNPVFTLPTLSEMRKAVKAKLDLEPFLEVYRALERKGAKPLGRLYQHVCDLNVLTEEAEIELEEN